MAKVKVVKLIDIGCRKYIVLADGRALDDKKGSCLIFASEEEARAYSDQVDKELGEWNPCIKERIGITGGVMYADVKEGDEIEV